MLLKEKGRDIKLDSVLPITPLHIPQSPHPGSEQLLLLITVMMGMDFNNALNFHGIN